MKLPEYIIWKGLSIPSIKRRKNTMKKKSKLYQISHNVGEGLFATATQFKQKKKKKHSPAFTGTIVNSPKYLHNCKIPKILLPFCLLGDKFEKAPPVFSLCL